MTNKRHASRFAKVTETRFDYRYAPVILMDEATASLDVDNEFVIQESISRLIRSLESEEWKYG